MTKQQERQTLTLRKQLKYIANIKCINEPATQIYLYTHTPPLRTFRLLTFHVASYQKEKRKKI
jgi:hypothetical protein